MRLRVRFLDCCWRDNVYLVCGYVVYQGVYIICVCAFTGADHDAEGNK